jgi:WD40 repeat protein
VIAPTSTGQLGSPTPVGRAPPADPGGQDVGVEAVAFSPDGKLLASADADGYVRLWNPATGTPVGQPLPADPSATDDVFGVALDPDGSLLASADGDGIIRTWPVELFADPYAVLCAEVGPPTRSDWTRYAPGKPQPNIYAGYQE